MALVAYSDDSDLGSDSENIEENVNNTHIETKIDKLPEIANEKSVPLAQTNSSPNPKIEEKPKPSSSSNDIVDEEDDEGYVKERPSILASIPAALPVYSSQNTAEVSEVDDELTDVPTVETWKVTADIKKGSNPHEKSQSTTSKKKEKSKVKFFVPALSAFDDEDEEEEKEEEPERKKLKPSAKGTGLFSVLPEPKHITVKEPKRSLIPHVLTKAPPVKRPSIPRPALEKKTIVDSNYSDDEDSSANDFFSLTESPADIGAVATVSLPSVKLPVAGVQSSIQDLPKAQTVVDNLRYEEEDQLPPQYASNSQQEELPHSYQNEETLPMNAPSMDQESMIRLMGKRRGKGEAINFIDVNADDALLTRDEWMTKALSEEKPTHSYSKKKEGLPSQKQKQKHQITYLAHQAKERELELKNNWAQNRMTKMQTQAKYGF